MPVLLRWVTPPPASLGPLEGRIFELPRNHLSSDFMTLAPPPHRGSGTRPRVGGCRPIRSLQRSQPLPPPPCRAEGGDPRGGGGHRAAARPPPQGLRPVPPVAPGEAVRERVLPPPPRSSAEGGGLGAVTCHLTGACATEEGGFGRAGSKCLHGSGSHKHPVGTKLLETIQTNKNLSEFRRSYNTLPWITNPTVSPPKSSPPPGPWQW